MDISIFFKKIAETLELGKIVEGPLQVKGGLTHRMFKVITEKGRTC